MGPGRASRSVCKDTRQRADSTSGATLLFTIFAIIILGAVAAAASMLVANTGQTTLANADALRAHYLALSGLNIWSKDKTGSFPLGRDSIILEQSGPDADGRYTITSTGVVRPGTGREARSCVQATRQDAAVITFGDDIDDFTPPKLGKTITDPDAIVIYGTDPDTTPDGHEATTWANLWSENVSRYADGWVRLGGNAPQTSGAVWYGGSKGACEAGVCPLQTGLRVYFGFTFAGYDDHVASKKYGDGFTFAVVTAENDPEYAAGGPASGTRGEYLGYAGPGPGGQGIRSPKIAVEIDTYPDRGSGDPSRSNSRRDASNANHVAIVYWGGDDTNCDDNVHGAGTNPQNPGGTTTGYVERAASGGANWLEDGEEHALRLEIHKLDGEDGATYAVRAWIDPTAQGRDDVTEDYDAEPPHLTQTVTFSDADNRLFSTVRLGFTEATGTAASQDVAIHDFAACFCR